MGVAKLIFSLFVPTWAGSFLGAKNAQVLTIQEVQQALQQANGNLGALEDEMRPLFQVMPKNDHNRLDPATARYALHRYFAHKYGWHVRGLEPSTSAPNSSMSIEKNRVPSFIQGLVERSTSGQGLELHHLAIFAATLSELIRSEMANDFEDVHSILGFDKDKNLDSSSVDKLLKTYLIKFLKGIHEQANSALEYDVMEADLVDSLISWFDAVMWVEDLRHTRDVSDVTRRNPFTSGLPYNHLVEVAAEVGHGFGSFQNIECTSLKTKLVDMEFEGTGRVPLTKFYSGINDDRDWPFLENAEYLRSLGALDETDPRNPRVVIPNYLGSRSLCVVPSSYYAVCCIDECEGLMSQVEHAVGEPVATPGRLAEVVANLRSDTVEAPRNLSTLQLTRLADIAERHQGHVPLHGRLFAQWMHHAYPRECRFPHESGTTVSMSQEEWLKDVGSVVEVTNEEVARHLNRAARSGEAKSVDLPWTTHEELVAAHRMAHKPTSYARVVVLLLAFASATLPVARASMKHGIPAQDAKPVRHLV